jgi:integrase
MTGMRRGEVLGLRWKDLDLERGRLSIRQTLVKVDNRPELSEPKTEKSRRGIALDLESVQVLRAHRGSSEELRLRLGASLNEADLVFSTPEGRYLHPDWFARTFARLARAAGLPVIRLHDLRHTWATLALDAGVKVWDVSDILGHANISITLDLYRHAVADTQDEGTTKVARFVSGDRS